MKKYEKIIFLGCSFTYSQDCTATLEFKDTGLKQIGYPEGKSFKDYWDKDKTYPALVGQRLGIEVENLGLMGNANDAMSHQLYNWAWENLNKVDFEKVLFVVGATTPYRFSTTRLADYRSYVKLAATTDLFPLLLANNTDNAIDQQRSDKRIPEFVFDDLASYRRHLADEPMEYHAMRDAFTLMGMKEFGRSQGLDICIIDMLYRQQQLRKQEGRWYRPELFTVFDNKGAMHDKVVEEGIRRKGGRGGFISAYTRHYTAEGYEYLADCVTEILIDRYDVK